MVRRMSGSFAGKGGGMCGGAEGRATVWYLYLYNGIICVECGAVR